VSEAKIACAIGYHAGLLSLAAMKSASEDEIIAHCETVAREIQGKRSRMKDGSMLDRYGYATHEVLNQPPPLVGYDLYDADPALAEALGREGAGWAEERVRALGVLAGGPEAIAWGEAADANPPVLRTHDRYGRRVDEVEFHPAWHRLLGTALEHGLHVWLAGRDGGPLDIEAETGRMREAIRRDDGFHDAILMRILASAWSEDGA
jgi:hypothetical protein